jgi:excinuclease ABC subunit C
MIDVSGSVLYVGKARNLKKRVSSYFQKTQTSRRLDNLVSQIDHVEVMITLNETEALLLENQLIKKFLPKYNILLRDDKSFPYIILSDHEFPRLSSHRGKRVGKSKYFGPYTNGLAVREPVEILFLKTDQGRACFINYKNAQRPVSGIFLKKAIMKI